MKIPEELEAYFETSFIMCFGICDYCNEEIEFVSKAVMYSDEYYLDQAKAMKDQGWIIPKLHESACKECHINKKLKHDPNAHY